MSNGFAIYESVVPTLPMLAFLSVTLGKQIAASQLSNTERRYLTYIELQAERLPRSELQKLLRSDSETERNSAVSMDEVFLVLKGICLCANSTLHFGVDKSLNYLTQMRVFKDIQAHSNLHAKARSVIFIMISWICMLYSATELKEPCHLRIDSSQHANLNTPIREVGASEYSICELIPQYGSLLPVKSLPVDYYAKETFDTLKVSLLNANTLVRIGGLRIQWVNNVSAHLSLDMEQKSLMIFAMPTFCDLHRFEGTIFEKIISGYYDQYSKPDRFSSIEYLREIRISYRLLFADDWRAYRWYRRIAPSSVETLGLFDSYLDELSKPLSSSTNSYSADTDFPILGSRLIDLQNYIDRQNPGTIVMLWRDRRDMLRWYTFWVVTIIGGLGIVIALLSAGLAAAQVYYAIPSGA
ncbi:uncharacterized protein N7483_003589 [Penicillium malachiteum]|uniref:uncharacterized protein n=1 Tax=Penicillium malachiteum TaxID=1324776 RepID=UPI0025485F4B|nr:uncharacterized protein N7483_003589 [Penicillium malachiteum]KAJ5729081.1 hypothetical protein N7483_003589 [Penicillium malachiteum]